MFAGKSMPMVFSYQDARKGLFI